MNVEDMKAALGAFKRCKNVLTRGGEWEGPQRFICNSLRGEGAEVAKLIVIRSLGDSFTYNCWLMDNDALSDWYSDEQIQAGRHAFVDACIAELERRIAAATGAK